MPGRKAPQTSRRNVIIAAAYRVAVRRRLAGLTIRDVARQAKLSSGLVLFHFKTKDALLSALLDWLLHDSEVLRPSTAPANARDDAASFCRLVTDEAFRLSHDRKRMELLFDFWIAGTRASPLRSQMRLALVRYRGEFHRRAEKLMQDSPFAAPSGLAGAAVSLIHGCAIQSLIDPDAFDLDATLAAVRALVGRQRAPAPVPGSDVARRSKPAPRRMPSAAASAARGRAR